MKDEDFWEEEAILKDLLFQSNDSLEEIASHLDLSRAELNTMLKRHGLDWVRRSNRKLSRGHAALTSILQGLLPGEKIVNEHHIGERLMLDIYCPSYKIAAEYHGRQHFFYTNFFHKDLDDFKASIERDNRKQQLCQENGITLIVFRFCDKLSEEAVFERLLEAIRSSPQAEQVEKQSRFVGNHYYEKMKQQNSIYRKKKYREIKKRKSGS